MKVVPKKLRGGSFDLFFTTYTPIQYQTKLSSSKLDSTLKSSKSEKDELSEKDFFNMIKSLSGLPNEKLEIVNNLINTLRLNKIMGTPVEDLSILYLTTLSLLENAARNKKRFDDILTKASTNGTLAEPAISTDGKLIVQNDNGGLEKVSLKEFNNNKSKYESRVLSVSNLANLRQFDPSLVRDQAVFDIIENSMSYELFLDLISKAIATLGSSRMENAGVFSNAEEATKGLAILNALRNDTKLSTLGSITADGLYKYVIKDTNLTKQIKALTSYINTLIPDRAKTWAAFKTGQTNKDTATSNLILTYLLGRSTDSRASSVEYKGDSASSNGSSSKNNPDQLFWSLILTDLGGDDFRFNILNKKGLMSINGKYYGATPGLDSNKSLGDYIKDGNVGYLIKNNKKITFGDKPIDLNSFNDVMINSYAGAAVVTLPITLNGTVDLDLTRRWAECKYEAERLGLDPNSQEYKSELKRLCKKHEVEYLVTPEGDLNLNRFGHFLVLEGYSSEKASIMEDTKQISLKDTNSDFIIPVEGDDKLYDIIKQGLSNKDRGEYKLSNGLFNDELFRGNIYIPLNTNPLNGANADNIKLNRTTVLLYEKAQQQNSTNSNNL